ncbi:MAG: pantothenate kinase [Candidatus Aminicenantes bacterium RBG_13_62_12]|nr:MAG: pantothenate kinase [Candidatus Aminicenantes bacterium RBG_13_62_12]
MKKNEKTGRLLAIDVGNTTVGVGVFEDRNLICDWRIRSDREKTADEYGLILLGLLAGAGMGPERVGHVILSSVVPPLTPVFQALSRRLFGAKPVVVGPGLKTGMPILYDNPLEVGADRITASVAAYEKHGGPCIVVDFGTAVTFDAVSARGEYLGGAIAPGIQIAAESLSSRTAKLPRVEIARPGRVIGRTTASSMQSGLFHGYAGLISHIIAEMKKELAAEARVVVTGGFAELFLPHVPALDIHEPHLVLEGLRILFERSRGDAD